jgi:hypothetical protein
MARIAQAEMAANDLEAAEKTFRAALRLERRLGEAWFGLALLELQLGDADATLAACREGLSCTLTEPQRAAVDNMMTMLARFEASDRATDRVKEATAP